MKKHLLLFGLISLFFLGCKKEEKQYSLRLVVDGGKYISTISRIANDKRIPIAIDTASGHLDIRIPALTDDELFLIRVTSIGEDTVNLKAYITDNLVHSKTLNKADKVYHQYFFSKDSPSEEIIQQFHNDFQRQIYEDQKEQF